MLSRQQQADIHFLDPKLLIFLCTIIGASVHFALLITAQASEEGKFDTAGHLKALSEWLTRSLILLLLLVASYTIARGSNVRGLVSRLAHYSARQPVQAVLLLIYFLGALVHHSSLVDCIRSEGWMALLSAIAVCVHLVALSVHATSVYQIRIRMV